MTKKTEQKPEENNTAGPLRKHRSRTEKIDDLKKQISDLRKAEREEQNKFRDERFIEIGKAIWQKAGKPKDIYSFSLQVQSDDFKLEKK